MGRQLQLFLHPEDVACLERDLVARTPQWVLHSEARAPAPRRVPSLSFAEEGCRWPTLYLVRPGDRADVVMRHVPARSLWVVDALLSPVIEFTGCFFDGEVLRRGRVYYADGFYEGGEYKLKGDGFRAWAKSVIALIRRRVKRIGSAHVGEAAAAWLAAGSGRLDDGFGRDPSRQPAR
jgi:hypothetical protein